MHFTAGKNIKMKKLYGHSSTNKLQRERERERPQARENLLTD